MAALLDEVSGGESQAILGGLSLGGYMSLAFNRVHPKRVKTLLIIDTGPGFKSDAARNDWNQTAIQIGSKFAQEGLQQLRQSTPERAQVTHRNAKGLAFAARGMLAQRNANIINSLPQIEVPALIIVGANDKPYLAASEYMTKKIPGAKKVVINHAGHAVNIDQPLAFNKAVVEYLCLCCYVFQFSRNDSVDTSECQCFSVAGKSVSCCLLDVAKNSRRPWKSVSPAISAQVSGDRHLLLDIHGLAIHFVPEIQRTDVLP